MLRSCKSFDASVNTLKTFIEESKHCVVYTGAGISTSAGIPDFRGPNGVWHDAKNGILPAPPEKSEFHPTVTHFGLKILAENGFMKHLVSQNCDGLHLKSGFDKKYLSEIHGNQYVEVCIECEAFFVRTYDVTVNTGFRKHSTSRKCPKCSCFLQDSVVHFGESNRVSGFPYNWDIAEAQAKKTDLIIVLGSSCHILKHYKCLWPRQKVHRKLVIINQTPTCKDPQANLVLHHDCDSVMQKLIEMLGFSDKLRKSIEQHHNQHRRSVPSSPENLPGWMLASLKQLVRKSQTRRRSRRITGRLKKTHKEPTI